MNDELAVVQAAKEVYGAVNSMVSRYRSQRMVTRAYAQRKGAFIDRNKHLVLSSAHPSPLSAYNGFFGNKHFSRANDYLKANGETEIIW